MIPNNFLPNPLSFLKVLETSGFADKRGGPSGEEPKIFFRSR